MSWNPDPAFDPLGFGFPTLGYAAGLWIEAYCCHGPGDVQGEPVELDAEVWEFLAHSYRLDPQTGRRVKDEAVLSRPKGRAKSEVAGFIGCFEAFGPARFSHWDENGQPVGRKIVSPFLKCLATEESQAGNTFANIAFIAGEWGQEHHPDVYTLDSHLRNWQTSTALFLEGGGEIRASTSGAASKDGGKETWACADETHLYTLRETKAMYGTVRRNLGKRKAAEPWMMQTSTAYRPGEGSIFEETLTMWRKQELPPEVYVNHREAKGKVDIEDHDHTLKQLKYVYGAASEWMDLERIYRTMRDVRSCPDEETAARYYLNRPLSSKDAWIPAAIVDRQERAEELAPGEEIALGFDGSLNDDSTVLIGSRMSDGFLFPIGIWAKPSGPAGAWWEVPRSDVLATVRETFGRYKVSRAYFDPHEWRSDIDQLAEEFGDETVMAWDTARYTAIGGALDRLRTDLMNGTLWHSGDPVFMEHFRNAYVRQRGVHRLVRKEHDKSDRKIDSVMGATLAYEARFDAIQAGWGETEDTRVFFFR